jgi:tRNA (guanine-N7-)-methyltransferase
LPIFRLTGNIKIQPVSRKKLIRFQQIEKFANVIEPSKIGYNQVKGLWRELVFGNPYPIVAELGCGKGEYTLGLATIFSDKNFVGVDIKGERVWKGASQALGRKLNNVAFLRAEIELLANFFGPGELSEIWLTFPDPRPKESEERKRLTSRRFLEVYRQILEPGGVVHLKTDDRGLFEYSLNLIEQLALEPNWPIGEIACTRDLYKSALLDEHYGLQTTYEKRFLAQGLPIYYLRFGLGSHLGR